MCALLGARKRANRLDVERGSNQQTALMPSGKSGTPAIGLGHWLGTYQTHWRVHAVTTN